MIRTASSVRRRGTAAVAAAVGLLALAAPAGAQSVVLQLRPRVGDTLRMRLTQRVEMTGTMRVGVVDSTATVVTTLRALTHTVVERNDGDGTVLVTTADSVDVTSTGGQRGRGGALGGRARRALEGRGVRLRVARDGSTEVLSDATLSPDLAAFFSQMPATLPRGAVAVGERWSRTMDMPAPGRQPGGRGAVSATFRLDSLSRGGALAHVSMRGVVTRRDAEAHSGAGMRVAGDGEVVGAIVVDQRRGWLSDARTTLTVRSVVTPLRGHGGPPMRFQMRVQEWLTAVQR